MEILSINILSWNYYPLYIKILVEKGPISIMTNFNFARRVIQNIKSNLKKMCVILKGLKVFHSLQ